MRRSCVPKFVLGLILTGLLSQTASAARSCETKLFGPKPEAVMAEIKSNLADYNYSIKKNDVLYKKVKNIDVQVGKLKIIQPRYLFEWQDQLC